ncbi:uncharacterized protein DDB_G0271670-like [Lutzomyia longipalpis]|uniref:uncharacterized protein DDB_G0271670-like n=1 Tax=Lutzomyia longipalpis TaxID=7200 RepID=UPI002483915D|nr:uncharacterized protein DDB_G0271670-like [Lutzomyia longipalpis]
MKEILLSLLILLLYLCVIDVKVLGEEKFNHETKSSHSSTQRSSEFSTPSEDRIRLKRLTLRSSSSNFQSSTGIQNLIGYPVVLNSSDQSLSSVEFTRNLTDFVSNVPKSEEIVPKSLDSSDSSQRKFVEDGGYLSTRRPLVWENPILINSQGLVRKTTTSESVAAEATKCSTAIESSSASTPTSSAESSNSSPTITSEIYSTTTETSQEIADNTNDQPTTTSGSSTITLTEEMSSTLSVVPISSLPSDSDTAPTTAVTETGNSLASTTSEESTVISSTSTFEVPLVSSSTVIEVMPSSPSTTSAAVSVSSPSPTTSTTETTSDSATSSQSLSSTTTPVELPDTSSSPITLVEVKEPSTSSTTTISTDTTAAAVTISSTTTTTATTASYSLPTGNSADESENKPTHPDRGLIHFADSTESTFFYNNKHPVGPESFGRRKRPREHWGDKWNRPKDYDFHHQHNQGAPKSPDGSPGEAERPNTSGVGIIQPRSFDFGSTEDTMRCECPCPGTQQYVNNDLRQSRHDYRNRRRMHHFHNSPDLY